jgi:hypothetical protein
MCAFSTNTLHTSDASTSTVGAAGTEVRPAHDVHGASKLDRSLERAGIRDMARSGSRSYGLQPSI